VILPVRPHFIFDLLPKEKREDFIIPVPCRESGSPTMLETALLIGLGRIVGVGPTRGIFEIGTYKGQTAAALSQNFPVSFPLEETAIIHTLDLDPEHAEENSDPDVRFLKGHSCAFDFTPFHGKMGLVFIDGAHDFETVTSDSANALKMLVPDGPAAIVWHDYDHDRESWPGVARAVPKCAHEFGLRNVYRVEDTRLAVYLREGK
jgi:Methyltransferase domain